MSATFATPKKRSGILKAIFGNLRIVDIMISILAMELIAGGIIVTRELIEARKIHSQIAQINKLDAAVGLFYEKYNGIPGDLLSAQADRMGLPTGDGTPAHSDGDGKIASCSPEWGIALGCESALFWSQLSSINLIDGIFTANVRFADSRVNETDLIEHYLPQSTLSKNIYLTVWNSNHPTYRSGNFLPNGNYFELTAVKGIDESKIVEDSMAISPLMSYEIDKKIDDGRPFSGKVIVNGNYRQNESGWNSYAETDPLECVTPDDRYNTKEYMKSHRPLCHLAIAISNPE